MTIDPLLRGVQHDAAIDLACAATNMAVTVELLLAAHRTAKSTGADTEQLHAAIELMSTVRDSLHQHAATLANAGRHLETDIAPWLQDQAAAEMIQRSLATCYGAGPATQIWSRLAAATGGDGPATVTRMIETMTHDSDPLLRLCGRSAQIQLAAHAHLNGAER